jgi:hypothetical protein
VLVATGVATGGAADTVVPGFVLFAAVFGSASAGAWWLYLLGREKRALGRRVRDHARVEERDIDAWYGNVAGHRDHAAVSSVMTWRSAVIASAGILVTIIGMIVVVEIVVSTVMAARFVQRMGRQTPEFVVYLNEVADSTRLAEFNSTLDRYAVTGIQTIDYSTGRELLRQLSDFRSGLGPLESFAGLGNARELLDSVLQRFEVSRAVDTLLRNRVMAFDEHPRLQVFRRISGAPTDAFDKAALDRPFEEYRFPDEVPVLRFGDLRVAAQTNASVAVLATMRGDDGVARQRLAENIAVSRRLMEGSTFLNNIIGRAVLRESVLAPLTLIERYAGNEGAEASLERASDFVSRLFVTGVRGQEGLMINPRDPMLLRLAVTNPMVPAGRKHNILFQAWIGLCGNPREMLIGPSEERREVMVSIITEAGIPHAVHLADMAYNSLRNPWLGSPNERPWYASTQWSPVMWVGRADLCSAY